MSYTELHFHLLPGVDDGPSSIEESVALAAAAAEEGTRTIVATTHVHPSYPTDVSSLPARVEEVVDRLRRERIRVRVICGGELSHRMVGSGERDPGRFVSSVPHAMLRYGLTARPEALAA